LRALLIFGVIAAGGVYAYTYLKKAAATFSVKVVGYGKPTIAGPVITIPFVVALHNPSPVPVNVDWVRADLYMMKGGQWVPAARVDQPLSVASGDSRVTIAASANLSNIFGGNVAYTVTAIAEALSNKLQIRIDLTARYSGVQVPTQTFTQTLQIT